MISASPILILQNIGNIGTVLVALPVALLLGMGREAVGMTHALSREPNVALIADKYGSESEEFRGVMVCYIVGTVFGSIFMSIVPPVFIALGLFSPEAAAMAVGCGSSSMMASGLAGVIEAAPGANVDVLTAFATISNVISSSVSVYLGNFHHTAIKQPDLQSCQKGEIGHDKSGKNKKSLEKMDARPGGRCGSYHGL